MIYFNSIIDDLIKKKHQKMMFFESNFRDTVDPKEIYL